MPDLKDNDVHARGRRRRRRCQPLQRPLANPVPSVLRGGGGDVVRRTTRRAGKGERDTNPSDFERAGERGRDAICIYSRILSFQDKLIKSRDDETATVTPNEQDQSEKRSQIRHKSAEAGERASEDDACAYLGNVNTRISRRQMTLFHAIHGRRVLCVCFAKKIERMGECRQTGSVD